MTLVLLKLVRVSDKKPPQWILNYVYKHWGVLWESTAVFTYGDVITTHRGCITQDLFEHEKQHGRQQKAFGDIDAWWKRYFEDANFRYDQELECYQIQYQWVLKHVQNKSMRFELLKHYAKTLSGDMYGNLVPYNTALQRIMNK